MNLLQKENFKISGVPVTALSGDMFFRDSGVEINKHFIDFDQ